MRSKRTRSRAAWALGALVLVGSASACDTVLLELILARDTTSGFEEDVKSLSRLLLDIGRAVRLKGGKGVRYVLGTYSRTWGALYEKYYLSPPPGHEENPTWRALCDDVTARLRELRQVVDAGGATDAAEEGPIHDALRASQQALTNFYLPAPRPGDPKAEFDIGRTLVAGLVRAAGGETPAAADLRSNLGHLETRVDTLREAGVLPAPEDAATAGFDRAVGEVRRAIRDEPGAVPAAIERLGEALEALRTRTLQLRWFSPRGARR